MNPAFELDQIHRYIDHLAADPKQLGKTVESHFFPVLQRIFFREGFEVRRGETVNDRRFPFLLRDLDLKRPEVAVDFSYTSGGPTAMLPSFAITWAHDVEGDTHLLVLRNRPLFANTKDQVLSNAGPRVRFIDFDGLKAYATNAFQTSARRERSKAVAIVVEMLEQLIRLVAEEGTSLAEIAWFDLERLFHRVLVGLGYKAHLTPSSGDGGRDVLACDIQVDDVHWYAVEIKHWQNRKPGAREVAAFLETTLREGRTGGLFLSTSGVSERAVALRTEVHEERLRFADGTRLTRMCEHFVANQKGIWQRHQTLRAFLFDESS